MSVVTSSLQVTVGISRSIYLNGKGQPFGLIRRVLLVENNNPNSGFLRTLPLIHCFLISQGMDTLVFFLQGV